MNQLNKNIELAEKHCQEKGERLTQKRKLVLLALLDSKKAISAYELVEYCKQQFNETVSAMAGSDRESKITLRVFETNKGVHITTEDTGVGIPEDILPRIFDPFYTTKEMGKGTGLGLSISYGIIRDMNGIIVADNIGNGARFEITLPIVK